MVTECRKKQKDDAPVSEFDDLAIDSTMQGTETAFIGPVHGQRRRYFMSSGS